jgi:5-hydroxyisourate hydrolase-like protein (transthyretin family)
MMKVGDLVRFEAPDDVFHGKKGIVVRFVESGIYRQGFHYEVQTFCGYTIVALSFEIQRLENEYHIPA